MPKADQLRIWNDLNLPAAVPRPIGRAEQIEKDVFRVPTGRYRSVYRVLDDDRLVAVFLIGHRRYVYNLLRRSGRETNPHFW